MAYPTHAAFTNKPSAMHRGRRLCQFTSARHCDRLRRIVGFLRNADNFQRDHVTARFWSDLVPFATSRRRTCVDATRDVPGAGLAVAASVCRAGVPRMVHLGEGTSPKELRVTMFPSRPHATIAARGPRNLWRSPGRPSRCPILRSEGRLPCSTTTTKINHTFKVCLISKSDHVAHGNND